MRQVMRRLLRQPLPQPVEADLRPRRDPAPTVWGYRYQRLMLTPLFRAGLRIGLPAFVVVFLGGAWISSADNRAAVVGRYEAIKDQIHSRPEFMVTAMEIEGADVALASAITGTLDLDLPTSSFDLDLEELRDAVTALTAVRTAMVRVRPGGTLEVRVEQREPVAVWRYVDGLRLVDGEGVMTGMIEARSDRADLPLIAGDGAREATEEAMALFATARPIEDRVRGLVRMGERRWDMVLEGGQRILLPAEGAVAALDRVMALHQAQGMLDLDILVVDMRREDRPTIRLSPYGAETMRRLAQARAGD